MTCKLSSYAGIGSRATPKEIESEIIGIAKILAMRNCTLRSGGADGADLMFEKGCRVIDERLMEIYLPWKGFNDNPSKLYLDNIDKDIVEKAREIARNFHPAWNRLSDAAKKLMTRNTFQILGINLDNPVKFVICWTKDGKDSGGTGQAIRIARSRGIPVYNLNLNKYGL